MACVLRASMRSCALVNQSRCALAVYCNPYKVAWSIFGIANCVALHGLCDVRSSRPASLDVFTLCSFSIRLLRSNTELIRCTQTLNPIEDCSGALNCASLHRGHMSRGARISLFWVTST